MRPRQRLRALPGFGDQQGLDLGQLAGGAHQQLEDRIERRRIRAAGLDHRLDVVDVGAEPAVGQARLVAPHPVHVAEQRVDLAVMREHAEGLRQPPGREGVGRIALVVDREVGDEAVVQQVGIEGRQLLGQEQALVDDRPAAQRADVEVGDAVRLDGLLDAPADDVEVDARTGSSPTPERVLDHDLLDLGPGGVGLLADHVDARPAPGASHRCDSRTRRISDSTMWRQRSCALEVGARQEDHADGEVPAARLVAGAADMLLEEVLRNLDVDAGAVAGLAVGVDRAAVPQRLERLDAGLRRPRAAAGRRSPRPGRRRRHRVPVRDRRHGSPAAALRSARQRSTKSFDSMTLPDS